MPTQRRSQADRAQSTRTALIGAARTLFTERGFANVPAEEVVRTAGVTRGALYHHFADKQELFLAVFEQLEAEITAEVNQAAEAAPDPRTAMVAALARFLDICRRPEVLRIGLTDAPAVLGWQRWREIEARHGLGVIIEMLDNAAADGILAVPATPALAQLLLSMVIESALMIAHAEDPDATRAQAEQSLLGLLAGLLAQP